ncbi:hypothetical protein A7K50_03440 [Dehalobacter sp. MCB1]|uniref:hypothetical protein n=1 Tax=Dehalobacter sp. MCB1 TaxID=1844756 RepID=UPI00037C5B4A|nr:hypothetical protein [Dehalobacter sp. MCB1]RJE47714.1 hypothetical protein A7K50_03440 [Dehalobacter sp. MCB1]
MKIGDKVYSQELGEDVIVVDIDNYDDIVQVYSDVNGYIEVELDDLLEYTKKPKSVKSTPAKQPAYSPVAKTIITPNQGGTEKMNIKKLMGEFGIITNGEVAITFDGKVVIRRNADEFVRYDAEKDVIENHMSLVFAEASKFMFILPVADVAEGDVIKVKGDYFQILTVKDNGSLSAVNINKGTKSTICKETNAFGFNFYYKVTSLFNNAATDGAFNPMMLMAMDGNKDDLLPLMLMSGAGGKDFASNPLLMMSILGDGLGGKSDIKDLLMLQAFSGGASNAAINPLMLLALK